jgi:hypothetical protein
MRMWMLAAGAAALAISAPALADKGGGGHGGGKGGQQAQQSGGHGKANRGGGEAKLRGQGGKGHGQQQMAARGHGGSDKGRGHADTVRVKEAHGGKINRHEDRVLARGVDLRGNRVRVADLDNDGFDRRWGEHGFARGFVDGCPPGLAKKNNGCLPPGQAKKLVGTILPTAFGTRSLVGPYRDWYRDDDRFMYRMGPDGQIYRVNRTNSLIDALIPGSLNDYGYYPVGMAYPSPYNFYNVPVQYSSYWPDSSDNYYRYGNGAIYQVDPRTSTIQGIVALLAGDLSVGQPLPMGYSAYNVPLAYRPQYYDTANNWYRYNDGYIYRVDPTTQLVTAVIRALV